MLLPLVADGALDAEADPALFAHLARCNECQDALARLDLVQLALETSRPALSPTAVPWRRAAARQVFLPWPAALAASLAAAAGLWAWLATFEARPQPTSPAPQVVQMLDKDGQPVYVVVQDGQVTLIDPRTIDGKGGTSQPQVVPVKFPTAAPPTKP